MLPFMVAHMVQNSSFYSQITFYSIQRNIFIFRKSLILLIETFLHIQRNVLHSEKILYLKRFPSFNIQRKVLYLEKCSYSEKIFIFKENVMTLCEIYQNTENIISVFLTRIHNIFRKRLITEI